MHEKNNENNLKNLPKKKRKKRNIIISKLFHLRKENLKNFKFYNIINDRFRINEQYAFLGKQEENTRGKRSLSWHEIAHGARKARSAWKFIGKN